MSRNAEAIRDEMLEQLLPRGAAWPKGPSNLASLLMAFAECRVVLEQDIKNLGLEIAPQTSVQMLDDYEAILGPACCDDKAVTLSQRQATAQARWTARKLVSPQDFIGFAAQLGFEIGIQEFSASRCGEIRCGDALQGEEWDYVWRLLLPQYDVVAAECGTFTSGDALLTLNNQGLRCEISARNPAHLVVQFGLKSSEGFPDFGIDIS